MDNNVFQHQFGDSQVASQILYGNLMNRGLDGLSRISPNAFVCNVSAEDGSKTCHMVISTPNSHVFSQMPYDMSVPPLPAVAPMPATIPSEEMTEEEAPDETNADMIGSPVTHEPIEPEPSCGCQAHANVCPTCGGAMPVVAPVMPVDDDSVVNTDNDPSIPDDNEIVAIVSPQDIYGHLDDSELYESVSTKLVESVIPHEFTTARAVKEIGKVLVKKYGGSYTQHDAKTATHVQKDGRINKVITEDNQYKIKSYKI